MRSAIHAIVAVLLCGCAAAAAKQATMDYRVLKSGAYAASSGPAPQVIVATDSETFGRLWNVLIGSGPVPQVDFADESAVFLVDRQRPTGGYALEARGVTVENGTVTVAVASKKPSPGSVTAQVLTTPFSVVAVHAHGIEGARWIDEGSGGVVAESARKR